MHPTQTIVAVVFGFTGLLFIGIAQPLIQRRIPPNGIYGFRMPDAFSSDAVWYAVNEYSARLLRKLGITVLVSIPVLLAMELPGMFFGLSMTVIIFAGTAAVVIRSSLYLQQLMKQ